METVFNISSLLIPIYRDGDERVLSVAKFLEESHNRRGTRDEGNPSSIIPLPSSISLSGLAGSSVSFIIRAVAEKKSGIHLIVAQDKEQAAYLLNDLETLTSALPHSPLGKGNKGSEVLFFPSSYKRPFSTDETDTSSIQLRAEVLNTIRHPSSLIPHPSSLIISYPEAIAEKVISKEELEKNSITIIKGEKVSLPFLTGLLNEYGFLQNDYVVEPGQFAVRGGIADIFSFANNEPYRIEFSGDEVETIRSFDVSNQLSLENLEKAFILPDIKAKCSEGKSTSIIDFILETKNESPTPAFPISEGEDNTNPPQGGRQRRGLEDLGVANNLYVWVAHVSNTIHSIEEGLKNIPETSEYFISSEEIKNAFEKVPIVEFGHSSLPNGSLPFGESGERGGRAFSFSPQPDFNKNFTLLFDSMKEFSGKGYTNLILCNSEKQKERLLAIYESMPMLNEFAKGDGAPNPPKKPDAYFTSQFASLRSHRADINQSLPHKFTQGRDMYPNSPELFRVGLGELHEGFIDHHNKIVCFTDHQIFGRYHRYKLSESRSKTNEAITLKMLKSLQPGDYVTHIDYGIGRFGGLEKITLPSPSIDGEGPGVRQQEAIRLVYRDNDVLYISIHSLHQIAKYAGKEGEVPKLDKLGSNAWTNLKKKTKKKIKELAFDLVKLYAQRKAKKGFAFSPDNYLQNELEASFIYEDTPDQLKATADVKRDMETSSPMDRLICGDVGFGKTEIAVRAAFKAAVDGKQTALLVPTTVLALQHFKTFSERMKDLPVKVDYLNRFKSAQAQKQSLKDIAEGKTEIIISTHRLFGKDVKFKDMGLLIVDEEQKFGVAAKEKFKLLKTNVDTLTLTATPIPRTLQFSLMGARDLSVINTPPPNRYPIHTEVHPFNINPPNPLYKGGNEKIIRDGINNELQRGGQVFFVHNRIQDIGQYAELIAKLCPKAKILVAHGQLKGGKLEKAMMDFIEGDYDVLVCTTIIESGLDIPNVNTIFIHNAQDFGLSDLYQLRGRVGRSNKKAFCYLLAPPFSTLTSEARKRLRAIEEFTDLGSGLNIALRDLDIRGAGNLLGAEQSGFITEIGYEMYQKILDEAMNELREEVGSEQLVRQKDGLSQSGAVGNKTSRSHPDGYQKPEARSFVRDCQIDTDLPLLIPDEYVENISERISLYRQLDNCKTEDELICLEKQLEDRFGKIPQQTRQLLKVPPLRWKAMELGFEKLVLKNGKMICYFISNKNSPYYQSEIFSAILSFVQQNQKQCRMKENKDKLTLTIENIRDVEGAMKVMKKIKIDM